MNKSILVVAGLAVSGGAFFVPWSPQDAAAAQVLPRDLYTVRRADLEVALVENGTMVAKESKKVTAKIKNEAKILFLVEEGKDVPEGEIVCKLDTTQVQTQLESIQLEILSTEANLKTARTELEIQTGENIATLTKAEVALDRATKEIEKYRDGEAPQERRKLEVGLKDTETDYNRAKKNLEDSKKLLELTYIKKAELEDHQITFERATVQKEGAEVALRMFDKYTFPMAMTDLETKLADAKREVATAQKRGEAVLGQKSVNVQQVEKRLKMQNMQLKERQEELESMVLKAPCPGILVYGNPHEPWYREGVKVGGQVYGGHTVMTIPDLRVMQVKLQIHEADISKLKAGLRASVTTDSYPGLQLDGEVTKIAMVAGSGGDWRGGGSSEVKKFDVEVTIKTAGLQLRPGISAKVEIHVETRPQTLFVPLQSAFAEDGVHYCHVQPTGKSPERRKIQIGTSNDTYLEVLDGLAEGDKVLLYNPMLPESGGAADAPPKGEATPAAAMPCWSCVVSRRPTVRCRIRCPYCAASTSASTAVSSSPSSAPPVRASRRCSTSSAASTGPPRGRTTSSARTSARSTTARCRMCARRASASCSSRSSSWRT